MKNPIPIIVFAFIAMIMFSGEVGIIIPAILFFIVFNAIRSKKKNQQQQGRNRPRGTGQQYDPYQRRRQGNRPRYEQPKRPPQRPRSKPAPPKPRPKANPYKTSGVKKYKDYDYDGAIEDFVKALEIQSNDIPTHFNIACAYSLTEEKDLAYQHIDKAVRLGFKDFEKLRTHDAFAFIRIQSDFEAFEKNGFKITAKMDIPQSTDDTVDPLLLERLKKLSELRDRGILTEAEFVIQKEKLLR